MDTAIVAVGVMIFATLAWLAWEVRAVHATVKPIAESNIVRGITSL